MGKIIGRLPPRNPAVTPSNTQPLSPPPTNLTYTPSSSTASTVVSSSPSYLTVRMGSSMATLASSEFSPSSTSDSLSANPDMDESTEECYGEIPCRETSPLTVLRMEATQLQVHENGGHADLQQVAESGSPTVSI
ncbi:unnamed protein product [Linum trigynum]|uniref:Uncharacterized protein n=1 Tax=Linum trigynum TaxID=586398 RepID=A0AAV2CZD9_9ROSI